MLKVLKNMCIEWCAGMKDWGNKKAKCFAMLGAIVVGSSSIIRRPAQDSRVAASFRYAQGGVVVLFLR